jgi:hypothetical protein
MDDDECDFAAAAEPDLPNGLIPTCCTCRCHGDDEDVNEEHPDVLSSVSLLRDSLMRLQGELEAQERREKEKDKLITSLLAQLKKEKADDHINLSKKISTATQTYHLHHKKKRNKEIEIL